MHGALASSVVHDGVQVLGRVGSNSIFVRYQALNMKCHAYDPPFLIEQVTTLFVTGDFGILMQDSFPLEEPLEALLGLQVGAVRFWFRGRRF